MEESYSHSSEFLISVLCAFIEMIVENVRPVPIPVPHSSKIYQVLCSYSGAKPCEAVRFHLILNIYRNLISQRNFPFSFFISGVIVMVVTLIKLETEELCFSAG